MSNLQVTNGPTFGMKYKVPKVWDQNILKAVKESNLVKQIDSKYPKASAKYVGGISSDGSWSREGVEFKLKKGFNFIIGSLGRPKDELKLYNETLKEIKTADLKSIEMKILENKVKNENFRAVANIAIDKTRSPFMKNIRKFLGIS